MGDSESPRTVKGVLDSPLLRRFPVSDERSWADVKVGGEHLRLFSEHNGHGVLVSVYNVNARYWITPFEPVDNIEHGKEKAAAYAEAYLNGVFQR
jgi:hypothetical protein